MGRSLFMKSLTLHLAVGVGMLAAVGLAAGAASGQTGPSGLAPSSRSRPALPGDDTQVQTISGTVDSYNLDPRGMPSGIVLKDGDRVAQLNLPPPLGVAISTAAPIGQKITATGFPISVQGARAIYRLDGLTTADGKQFNLPRPGEQPEVSHVEGIVKQLNYAPRGEVDGVILDTGDFVHVGPREAAQLNLAVGLKITAEGYTRPMLAGHNAIEATKVNDLTIDRPRPPQDGPPDGGPRGKRGPRDGGPPGPMRGGPDGDDRPQPPPPENQ
jgi:hypothetical protein